MDRKYVILECDALKAKQIIINHVRDIYMGNRNFHFLLTSLVMDDYLNEQVSEFGAVNITGFRILKPNTQEFRQFFNMWKKLNHTRYTGAGKPSISVIITYIKVTSD
jgi:hypothetical protein